MPIECNTCGNEYQRIGSHWSQSDCPHPMLSSTQREILTGLLMGDGSIERSRGRNPLVQCAMVTKPYLDYLDGQFGALSTGVRFESTGEELAERAKRHMPDSNINPENYQDLYRWRTRRNPNFQEFADWYATGKKVFPDSIELTPTVLKHWYCGDGQRHQKRVVISLQNEVDNKEKIERYFEKGPAVSVQGWEPHKIRFSVSDSEELYEYMGEPLPGFEYKWPGVK